MGSWQLSPEFLKARLSRRIALWVFLSIVAIEAIILVPSVMRREQELLNYLKSLSAAQATGILEAQVEDLETVDGATLLAYLAALQNSPVVLGGPLQRSDVVLGGTLYRLDASTEEGRPIGSFGEAPTLSLKAALQAASGDRYHRQQQRYDAVWEMSPLADRYVLIIRHDASGVRQEFYAFIGRITGLVLVISAFVTGATMVVLDRIVISPVLGLRRDLLRAGRTIQQNQDARTLPFESAPQAARRDELGDVVSAFRQMVQQIGDAIAERSQAEADLRLSEEKFSKAFHASPNPMSLTTVQDGALLEVNDSFLSLYGAPRQAVLGNTVLELGIWLDERDRATMLETLNQMGFIRNQEYRFRTRSGRVCTVLLSVETIDLHGQPCLLSVVSDITERKAAEEALRESEQRFRTLVEQATDALFVVDTDGRFLDVNQQACLTLGYGREELLSLTVADVQMTVNLADCAESWQIAPGQPITREGVHRRKDGSTFPVEVRIGLIDIQGRSVLLALARDITERKQMEQAQARLAEIGELAAMIVHEVRNPLTTILMSLHAFEKMALPERGRLRLSFALEESERLQRLLNEILLYAREQSLTLKPLDLRDWLQDLLANFAEQPVAASRSLRWQGNLPSVQVVADADKLKQVFINLLSNACEAVEAGEPVTCSLRRPTSDTVEVRVHNGGDPIPPEVLPKLMQPFFTTKSSGNGLGLAITRRIVEAHHGQFWLESTAATGTIAVVQLPIAT